MINEIIIVTLYYHSGYDTGYGLWAGKYISFSLCATLLLSSLGYKYMSNNNKLRLVSPTGMIAVIALPGSKRDGRLGQKLAREPWRTYVVLVAQTGSGILGSKCVGIYP